MKTFSEFVKESTDPNSAFYLKPRIKDIDSATFDLMKFRDEELAVIIYKLESKIDYANAAMKHFKKEYPNLDNDQKREFQDYALYYKRELKAFKSDLQRLNKLVSRK